MKKRVFTGSATAMVTPFTAESGIDFEAFERIIEFQIENCTQALVICGTTGESATLPIKERNELVRFCIKRIAGRIPVIVGTGSNCTTHSLELSLSAEKLGANALVIVTPYYNKCSQEGLVNHYNFIAERVNLPIILYNVPSRTGVNIAPQTYQKLCQIPNIVAVKEANGDISSIITTKSLCGDELDIYSGNDDQTLPILSIGGIGVISVFSNICPRESQMICEYKSTELLMKYKSLMDALFSDVNPIPIKAALNLVGLCRSECRMPLSPLKENKLEELKKELRKVNLI